MCLLGPGGDTLATADDSGRNCNVPGPFGASLLEDFVLPTDGEYTVVATSFQGLGDEIGTYELTILGCVANRSLDQVGGVTCAAAGANGMPPIVAKRSENSVAVQQGK